MQLFKELDIIKLNCDIIEECLYTGDIGTIVHIYPDNKTYEIEIYDNVYTLTSDKFFKNNT